MHQLQSVTCLRSFDNILRLHSRTLQVTIAEHTDWIRSSIRRRAEHATYSSKQANKKATYCKHYDSRHNVISLGNSIGLLRRESNLIDDLHEVMSLTALQQKESLQSS